MFSGGESFRGKERSSGAVGDGVLAFCKVRNFVDSCKWVSMLGEHGQGLGNPELISPYPFSDSLSGDGGSPGTPLPNQKIFSNLF